MHTGLNLILDGEEVCFPIKIFEEREIWFPRIYVKGNTKKEAHDTCNERAYHVVTGWSVTCHRDNR